MTTPSLLNSRMPAVVHSGLPQEIVNSRKLDVFDILTGSEQLYTGTASSTLAGKASYFSLGQEQPGFEAARKSSSFFGSVLPFNSETTSPFYAESLDFESWSDQYENQQLFRSSRIDEIPSSSLPLPTIPLVSSIFEDQTQVPSFTSLSPLVSADVKLRPDQFKWPSLPVPSLMGEPLSSSPLTIPPKSKKRKQPPHQDKRQENSVRSSSSSKITPSVSHTSKSSKKKKQTLHKKDWKKWEIQALKKCVNSFREDTSKFKFLERVFKYLSETELPHRTFSAVKGKYHELCAKNEIQAVVPAKSSKKKKQALHKQKWKEWEIQALKKCINSCHEDSYKSKSLKEAFEDLSKTELPHRTVCSLWKEYHALCTKNEVQAVAPANFYNPNQRSSRSKSETEILYDEYRKFCRQTNIPVLESLARCEWLDGEIQILIKFIYWLQSNSDQFCSKKEAFQWLSKEHLKDRTSLGIESKYRSLYRQSQAPGLAKFTKKINSVSLRDIDFCPNLPT